MAATGTDALSWMREPFCLCQQMLCTYLRYRYSRLGHNGNKRELNIVNRNQMALQLLETLDRIKDQVSSNLS